MHVYSVPYFLSVQKILYLFIFINLFIVFYYIWKNNHIGMHDSGLFVFLLEI